MIWYDINEAACVLIALSGFLIAAILLRSRRRLIGDPLGREVFLAFGMLTAMCGVSRMVEFAAACRPTRLQAMTNLLTALTWTAAAVILARFKLALIRSGPP